MKKKPKFESDQISGSAAATEILTKWDGGHSSRGRNLGRGAYPLPSLEGLTPGNFLKI